MTRNIDPRYTTGRIAQYDDELLGTHLAERHNQALMAAETVSRLHKRLLQLEDPDGSVYIDTMQELAKALREHAEQKRIIHHLQQEQQRRMLAARRARRSTVFVVFDLETGGDPFPLGVLVRMDEDCVAYEDRLRGGIRYAPADCVQVVGVEVPS